MNKFQEMLEKYLMPISIKLSNNKILSIIRDAFIATLPLTIAGSLSLIIQYFPFIDYVVPADIMTQVITFLDAMSTATLSVIGLFLAGAIGYYYCKYDHKDPLFGIVITISSFLIVTPAGWNEEGAFAYFALTWLGGQGLFTAMIIGFLSVMIYCKLIDANLTIKMPDSVPPMVAEPFKALIPATITFVVIAAIRYAMGWTSYGDIHTFFFEFVQQPLTLLGTSLPASIILVIVIQLLWFMGLHGQNIVGAVMNPIWTTAMVANLTATQNHQAPQYIFTGHFFSGFIWMQFFSLVIACAFFSKSNQLKTVGKISVGSAIFNISEPIVFGSPVVLNFTLLIPWVLTMVIYVLITWAFMASGLCPLPLGTDIPWTTPPIISGYLITGSFMGAVVQIVNLIVGTFVYLPFVKMYDKQLLKAENKTEELIEE